ncbi:OmpP1/FadL family transporter [Hymenobacter arizonensis]|uniref:Outer membrane protein transport protein (OMPP1/FadL/TodX) n=1 Tax=Hymenobacter arizonensis TaxID=1227077 RepID=A0A1I6B6K6_HYMAR|nr:hypothetical protein [Hymenobacter arizonensis]SFQ76572.1 hypothetical protein SAMN04515668_4228 [Hymenobacter arizonensis]
MKKRIIWLSLALVAGSASHAFAQFASDALRHSRLQFGGPARTLGIGGANVALGADFGNLTSNPAGLGMYQKSELHFTPGVGFGQGEGRIEGNSAAAQEATQNSFHVGSAGLVFTTRRPDDDQTTNWRAGSFALGFTRVADFNSASNYQGSINNNQSFLSRLRPQAGVRNQAFYDDLDNQFDNNRYTTNLGLAYGAFLADVRQARTGARRDSAVVLRQQGSVLNQGELVTTSGSQSQFDLGYGASYRDRLYIGGAIGIVSSNFTETRVLSETDNDPSTYFIGLRSRTVQKTQGSGVNARVGAIYRATDNLRVGASVQTPTYMRFTETFDESLTSEFSAQGADRVPSDLPVGERTVAFDPNDYEYALNSPLRANGGLAYTIGKLGFITGDVEYVGYGRARFANTDDVGSQIITDENNAIKTRYQSALNLRLGAEGRFDIFRARLGFARYGSPYKTDTGSERAQNFYTGGIGMRQGNFFIDAAAVYTTFNQIYTPYSLVNGLQPVVNVSNNRFTTSVTAGVTF